MNRYFNLFFFFIGLTISCNLTAKDDAFNLNPNDYLIPSHHHVKHFLDKILMESNALKNAKLFARAGFETICLRPRGHLRIARHPDVPGYLFKVYLGNVAGKNSNKFKRLVQRAASAAKVRKIIHKHKMRWITVPDKWLYEIPSRKSVYKKKRALLHKGLPNKKKYLLVVQDMELVSRAESEHAWKHKMTPDILRHLYHILDSGYASIAVTQNIAHTKYGTYSCIDTEFAKRKIKLTKLDRFLSSEMRDEWHKIIRENSK